MARKRTRKRLVDMPVVSTNGNCIVKVSIEERRVIIDRLPELWMNQGYTSTEFKEDIPKDEEYPLDIITLQEAAELHNKKGMVIHCSSGHVLGIYRESNKTVEEGVNLYGEEKTRACV